MRIFDTETTGLGADADVLEYGLIDENGVIIMSGRCSPARHKSWPEAQKIHGIEPGMVAGLPLWSDIYPLLAKACKGHEVIIYNAAYDMQYCPGLEELAGSIKCCMNRYAEWNNEWDDYHDAYKWHKLVRAAKVAGYEWPETMAAHNATGDALATLAVWKFLDEQGDKGSVLHEISRV